jgi:hypothetical protein
MKTYLLRAVLFSACLLTRLPAADSSPANAEPAPVAEPPPTAALAPTSPPSPEDQKKLEDAIRTRLAEHALKKANAATAAADTPAPGAPPTPITPAKEDPTMLLPRIEVNKSRITDLAIALHEKDVEIAREKKNIKSTPLDDSLNDTEVSHKLAILGGSSAEDRSRLAEERVSLLEAERDLIEQIFNARTPEERDQLQKQMDDLKTMRRQLERSPKDTRGE